MFVHLSWGWLWKWSLQMTASGSVIINTRSRRWGGATARRPSGLFPANLAGYNAILITEDDRSVITEGNNCAKVARMKLGLCRESGGAFRPFPCQSVLLKCPPGGASSSIMSVRHPALAPSRERQAPSWCHHHRVSDSYRLAWLALSWRYFYTRSSCRQEWPGAGTNCQALKNCQEWEEESRNK